VAGTGGACGVSGTAGACGISGTAGACGAPGYLPTVHAYTVSSNAVTIPITYASVTITNNAAGSVAITLTTTSAADGQTLVVRFYDYSAAAQTLSWVNTENSTVSAPLTSNGSTTLPLSIGFIFNGGTSKWRCVAVA
jgi:hypothetical protein